MTQRIEDILKKLHTYYDSSFPILSVYLEIPEGEKTNATLVSRFRDMIPILLDDIQYRELHQDIEYVDAFLQLNEHILRYRGVAIFTGGNKLWEVVTTPFPLPTFLNVNHSPYLYPIQKELHIFDRFLVILADREKAKFFTLYSGELEDQIEFKDKDVPQKIKGRNMGTRTGKVDRHIQEHLNHHFKIVAEKVNEFSYHKPINGVVVGGHKELIHRFEEHLPKHLRDKIIGEFNAEPDMNMNELLNKSKEVLVKAKHT